MLLVARALLVRPRLMLIDEITEGLQPSVVERLAAALRPERERRDNDAADRTERVLRWRSPTGTPC
jgi:ABC-type branched-subunit amino acid transport system ATPase component